MATTRGLIPRLKIISGGQTGVDRAALDFALRRGIPHGGSVPAGRLAEDGVIPARYLLTEINGSYRQRTRQNVMDSDATLILTVGELEGGSLATFRFAEKLGKLRRVVYLDRGKIRVRAEDTLHWLAGGDIRVLNLAGPRESKCPGIYSQALEYLEIMLRLDSDEL